MIIDNLNKILDRFGKQPEGEKFPQIFINGTEVQPVTMNLVEKWVEIDLINDNGDVVRDTKGENIKVRVEGEITFKGGEWFTKCFYEYSGMTQ